jgi:hypothetical protein
MITSGGRSSSADPLDIGVTATPAVNLLVLRRVAEHIQKAVFTL